MREKCPQSPLLWGQGKFSIAADAPPAMRRKKRGWCLLQIGNSFVVPRDYGGMDHASSAYTPDGTLILRFGRALSRLKAANSPVSAKRLSRAEEGSYRERTEAEMEPKPEDAARIERIVITKGEDEL